jgi:hypothetical protein
MKKTTLYLLLLLLFTVTIHAQTTYTYSGNGDWSNTANWSPSYPGTTINAGDTVVIIGEINLDLSITNSGTLNLDGFIDGEIYSESLTNTTTGTINTTETSYIFSDFTNDGTLINPGYLYLYGELDGSGTVTNNGTIESYGDIANNSSHTFTNSGTFYSDSFFKNVSFTNYGTLNLISGSFDNDSSLTNTTTGTINTSGNVDILDADFTNNGILNNDGTLNISGYNFTGSGTVINNGTVNHSAYNNSNLTYNNTGIYNTNGTALFTNGTFTNSGTFNINTDIISVNGLTNTASGTVNIIGSGNLLLDLDIINNEGTINNNSNRIVAFYSNLYGSGSFTNDGSLTVHYTFESAHCTNNGTITVNNFAIYKNTSQLLNTGTFNNNGTLTGVNTHHTGNFSNSGILSPGNSPGTYTFNEDYTHEATATLITELESTSSYDKVFSYGNVTLGGTLDVSLLNGYTPTIGDSFTIVTANSITGTFDTTNLPSGYTWNVNYTATEVILEVAPTLSSSDFDVANVTLYPNPASNFIAIQGIHTEENYTIYNTLGQEVKKGSVTNNAKIDIQNLNIGLYFLKFEKGETIKFLKE